jgi:hypothetical protein
VDVDEYVLNFFEKFHKSSLFADMNLVFDNHLSKCNLLEFMPKIMPMISSINSINSHTIDLFKLVYKNNSNDDNDNSDNEYYSRSSSNESQLLVLKQLMAKTRILLIDWLDVRHNKQRCFNLIDQAFPCLSWAPKLYRNDQIFYGFIEFGFFFRSYCECPWEDKIDWCCQWLNSPREDGKPRMLISYFSFEKSTPALMMRILKVTFSF